MTSRIRNRRQQRPVMEPLDVRLLMKVIYVDPAPGLPGGNGLSWSQAFTSPMDALAFAAPGDEIRVAAGTYTPHATDRTATFTLKNNVTLRGGYAGYGEPNPDARDTTLYPSVLSGEINSAAQISDNSIHVVTATNLNSTAVLEGFTITAGHANSFAAANQERGGGVYISSASPTISNCIITANRASQYGEGMYVGVNSSPAISNCTFSNNGIFQGNNYGGAIYNEFASPTITGCTFTGNTVYIGAAAIHAKQSNVTITGCTFTANHSRYAGSAIASEQNSSLTVRFCTFSDNIAELSAAVTVGTSTAPSTIRDCTFTGNTGDTGGVAISGSAVSIDRCDFIRNVGNYAGGAIRVLNASTMGFSYCRFYANDGGLQFPNQFNGGGAIFTQTNGAVNLYHCEFVGNRASNGGAIMDLGAGGTIARNCTIVANLARTSGGAIFNNAPSGNPTRIVNSIVRGNSAPTGAQIAYTAVTPDVRYSNIEGGFVGTSIIDADAEFLRNPSPGGDGTWRTSDDDYGDLRVHFTSPGIDAGNNIHTSPNYLTDIDGQPFFDFPGANDPGTIVDQGAHELGVTLALVRAPAGQTIALPAGGHTFVVEQLQLGAGAMLDLKDSDVVLRASSTGSWNGSAYTGVTGLITSGVLTTSMSDIGDGTTRVLGVASASEMFGLSGSQTTLWNGRTVDASSAIVKYTYAGDVDLNGEINGDDYFYLDSHVLHSGVVFGYTVGDINLDGQIDGDDYFWLDSQAVSQGGPL